MFLAEMALALILGAEPASFPAFALRNFDGREISSASLEGSTVAIVPTYAKCIFACPMVTFFLTELDKKLGSPENVRYLHVSVQPEEDTAAEILDHFEEHGIDAEGDRRWLFANGPPGAIQDLLEELGVEVTRTRVAEGVLIEHTIRVFVVGPRGQTLRTFDTYFWDEQEMHHALRYELDEKTDR